MKLFNAIASAAIISASLLATSPANAFWWDSKASYEKIEDGMTSGELDRVKKQAIKEEGWIYSWTNPSNRNRYYIKKFDCRGSKCMYFSTTNNGTSSSPRHESLLTSVDNTLTSEAILSTQIHAGQRVS